jgi:hypothetical protein
VRGGVPGPGVQLEAIPKSGATIDSQSGKPLAAMVASALGVPVTMLLADPGVTGARATAETLDKPTILEMGMRRACGRWCSGVILLRHRPGREGTARAAQGHGRPRPYDRPEVITLAGDVERTVDVDWPDLNELDPEKLIEAIVAADGTDNVAAVEIARLLLQALG